MAIKTPKDDLIILPEKILPHLKNASAEELKTLIYIFANPDVRESDAARELGMTVAQTNSALAFWRGTGIITEAAPVKKHISSDTGTYRNYDSETLSKAIKENEDFSLVCRVAGDRLEKQLTKNDYSSLFHLFDFVGISAPVICGIIEMCCAEDKKSLQYIYKKSIALYEDGIDSYDKFEEYLARREFINGNIGKFRRLCGMGERALTSKEKQALDRWFGEWHLQFELIKLAYEKTIDNTGKLSMTYMNSILRSWHESGFETEQDVANGEAGKKGNTSGSFDGDEFLVAALKRGFGDENK